MYKHLAFLLLLPLWAPAQVPQSFQFTLRGQVDPRLDAPAKVYLFFNGGLDSAAVTHGRFELRGRVDNQHFTQQGQPPAPGMGSLLLSRTGRGAQREWFGSQWQEVAWLQRADWLRFYMEPGVITFSSPDSLREAHVRGPRLNTEWQELLKAVHPYPLATQSLDVAHKPTLARFVAAHPASLVSLDQVRGISYTRFDTALVRRLYHLLTPALRRSPTGQKIARQLTTWRDPVGIGQRAPTFRLPTLHGDSVSTGRWVLLRFYASNAAADQAQDEAFLRVRKAIHEQKERLRRQYINYHTPPPLSHFGFEVLNIAVDGPVARATWLAAGSPPPTSIVLLDQPGPHSVAARYRVTTTPQNFLLDGTGRIMARNISSKKLQALLEQELQQVLKQ